MNINLTKPFTTGIKKISYASIIFSLMVSALSAQEFEPSIDLSANVVSNYVFRGSDIHQNKFFQDGEQITGTNVAPAFQPTITFNFLDGWSMSLWGNMALTGREDTDQDGQFQYGPGGSTAVDLLASPTPGSADFAAAYGNTGTGCTADTPAAAPTSCSPAAILSAYSSGSYTAPGFYNERNGQIQ